jgi:hypothetical protein
VPPILTNWRYEMNEAKINFGKTVFESIKSGGPFCSDEQLDCCGLYVFKNMTQMDMDSEFWKEVVAKKNGYGVTKYKFVFYFMMTMAKFHESKDDISEASRMMVYLFSELDKDIDRSIDDVYTTAYMVKTLLSAFEEKFKATETYFEEVASKKYKFVYETYIENLHSSIRSHLPDSPAYVISKAVHGENKADVLGFMNSNYLKLYL